MSTERVDTLIIGSGVAATAVASQLLEANPGARIVILEAGPKVPMKDFRLWTEYMVTEQKPYAYCEDLPYPAKDTYGQNRSLGATVMPLQGARLLIYGGSTVHWGGWSFRLKPEDFHLHSNTGHGIDWPFGYDELEPFYNQAEAFIGVSGSAEGSPVPRSAPYPFPAFPYTLEDRPMMQAMEAAGISFSHLPIARHGITDTESPHAPCMTTGTCKYCPFGARFVAGNSLDLLLMRYEGLEARYHAVVEELVMASATQVRGAVYMDRTCRERKTVEAKRVIVAAGAIESPKLLLRSRGGGWDRGVGNHHDLVGRNLITHPFFTVSATLPENPLGLRPEMDFPTLVSRYFDSKKEQDKGKFVFINPPSSPSVDVAAMMKSGMSRADIDAALTGPATVQIQGMVEVFSELYNRVQNLPEPNQFGLPQTAVSYSKASNFDARMAEIAGIAARLFEHMGAEPHLAGDPNAVDVSWRADHAACTCRMADSPDQGVVDADLRVHGVDNLYVCSNAVFASLGAVNPTLTLTALSLRLGQHLASMS